VVWVTVRKKRGTNHGDLGIPGLFIGLTIGYMLRPEHWLAGKLSIGDSLFVLTHSGLIEDSMMGFVYESIGFVLFFALAGYFSGKALKR
jgi:hypothetical protein